MEKRPKDLPSRTFGFHLECGNTYITICYQDGDPFDIFMHKGRSSACGRCVAEAVGKLCSIALRSGTKKELLIEHLQDIECGSGGWEDGVYVGSCFDAIAKSLGG